LRLHLDSKKMSCQQIEDGNIKVSLENDDYAKKTTVFLKCTSTTPCDTDFIYIDIIVGDVTDDICILEKKYYPKKITVISNLNCEVRVENTKLKSINISSRFFANNNTLIISNSSMEQLVTNNVGKIEIYESIIPVFDTTCLCEKKIDDYSKCYIKEMRPLFSGKEPLLYPSFDFTKAGNHGVRVPLLYYFYNDFLHFNKLYFKMKNFNDDIYGYQKSMISFYEKGVAMYRIQQRFMKQFSEDKEKVKYLPINVKNILEDKCLLHCSRVLDREKWSEFCSVLKNSEFSENIPSMYLDYDLVPIFINHDTKYLFFRHFLIYRFVYETLMEKNPRIEEIFNFESIFQTLPFEYFCNY
jgi:hypothetical protein